MPRSRMCRWHDCADPCYSYIERDGFSVPLCGICNESPPVAQLIPKLSFAWQPAPTPPDEEFGKLNLCWPESVFGKSQTDASPASQTRIDSDPAKETVRVDTGGTIKVFDLVDDEPLEPKELRLMTILPSSDTEPVCVDLRRYADDNIPEYQAVSYSLGGESRKKDPTSPVYVGKLRDVMVLTPTCESMLRFLSPHEGTQSRPLWFDYLCINQFDTNERNQQQAKMGYIYGHCLRVIVYLGPDLAQRLGPGEYRSRHWLHEIDEKADSNQQITTHTLSEVLALRYFERTWIIQELLLAETVIIPIGRCDIRAGLVALNRGGSKWDWEGTRVAWMQHMGQTNIYSRSLVLALRQTWRSEVTDRRDKIFGILGLVEEDPEFKPSASLSWLSTFIGTCAHVIKRGHTELLLKSKGKNARTNQLSWLPDERSEDIWDQQDRSMLAALPLIREEYRLGPSNLDRVYPIHKPPKRGADPVIGQDRSDRTSDQDEMGLVKSDIKPQRGVDVIYMLTPDKEFGSERSRGRRMMDFGLERSPVAALTNMSWCERSGALRFTSCRLLTLTMIPLKFLEISPSTISDWQKPYLGYLSGNSRLLAFSFGNGHQNLNITTLDGPLDSMDVGDELFLDVGAFNTLGMLLAVRKKVQDDCYRLLFACVCVDILFLTEKRSSEGRFAAGAPISPTTFHSVWRNGYGGDPQAQELWFRSPFGKSLSSVIRQCHDIRKGQALYPSELPLEQRGPRLTNDFSVDVRFSTDKRDKLHLSLLIPSDDVLLLSQTILDDIAEQDETNRERGGSNNGDEDSGKNFVGAFEKLIISKLRRYTVVTGPTAMIISDLSSHSRISVDRMGTPSLHELGEFEVHPQFRSYGHWMHSKSWTPKGLSIDLKCTRAEITRYTYIYWQLSLLSGFRGWKGMNETQLLENCDPESAELSQVYTRFRWPCKDSVVTELGLSGEVMDIQIL